MEKEMGAGSMFVEPVYHSPRTLTGNSTTFVYLVIQKSVLYSLIRETIRQEKQRMASVPLCI